MKFQLILSAPLAMLCISLPCFADEPAEAINLNNNAVKELSKRHWNNAELSFVAALKSDPNYFLARRNLAILHYNWGKYLKPYSELALKHFHKSLLLFDDENVRQEINAIITSQHKNPNVSAERVALGDNAANEGDFTSAASEYLEALHLRETAAVKEKLEGVMGKIDSYYRSGQLPDADVPDATVGEKDSRITHRKLDDGSYLGRLQANIKKHWTTTSLEKSFRVVVSFDVDASGQISNINTVHSTPDAHVDQVLTTLKSLDPSPPELQGTKKLTVKVSFDYDGPKKILDVSSEFVDAGGS